MYRPKDITITRTRMPGIASCEQCGTTREWTRELARQHANRRRHTVRFVVEDVTRYEPKDTPS